jgi:hypothetical protein
MTPPAVTSTRPSVTVEMINRGLALLLGAALLALAAMLPGTGWQSIIPWKFSPHIHPGQMNNVAILADEMHFTLFINGKYVDEAINTAIERGEVRLAAQNVDSVEKVTCEFDNLELRARPVP